MLKAFDEERFGPIAVITTFRTDEEAIAIANARSTDSSQPSFQPISHAPSASPTDFILGSSISTTRR
jgi:hypothetical protein